MNPFEPLSTAHSAIENARARGLSRKGNASNVVIVTTLTPRQSGGYAMTCEVHNASPNGIADIAVRVKMESGHLELNGEVITEATAFARNAVVGRGSTKLALPHTVRLSSTTFDIEEDHASSITATLYWSDESGKTWMRIGPGRAKRSKLKEQPRRLPG